MVYTVWSTPADTAALFTAFHQAPNREALQRLIQDSPIPAGSVLSLKRAKSEVFDQGRLNLSKSLAGRVDRVFGVATHINSADDSANTWTPACAQVMFRYSWWDYADRCNRSVFLRANAFSAHFAPRVVSNQPRHLIRGDFASGLVRRPSSVRNTTNLAAWNFADIRV